MRPPASIRAFTLVELIVSLTLATILMAAMFSSYLFLGRNLTRLSYQHILEQESRTILTTLTIDLRKTKTLANSPAPSSTAVTLNLIDGTTVAYAYSAGILTRNSVPLVKDIVSTSSSVPVTMPTFTFNYYTTVDGSPVSPYTGAVVPLSVKQIEFGFVLQAGTVGLQDLSGTLTQYQIASGRIPLLNRQLPDGS